MLDGHPLLFVGEFPPPMGGVTVKNTLLLNEVFADTNISTFDLYVFKRSRRRSVQSFFKLIAQLRRADRLVVGVGSNPRLALLLRLVSLVRGRSFLQRTTVFIMGRTLPDYISANGGGRINEVKCLFVESNTLVRELAALGVVNSQYLPNFRSGRCSKPPRPVRNKIRFVFFAKVCREKGADILLEAVRLLNDAGLGSKFDVSFYGVIDPSYEPEFLSDINCIENTRYMGIFDATSESVYDELNQYDSSVSASKHQEGMSGTNIECKFAGIASIASDVGFNAESINDGVDGLLVEPQNAISLSKAMQEMIVNPASVFSMKEASFSSRTQFDVAAWLEKIETALR